LVNEDNLNRGAIVSCVD